MGDGGRWARGRRYCTRVLETGIVTADPDRLIDFYVDGFGFGVTSTDDFPQGTVHRLRRGEARVKVFQPADGARSVARPDPWHAIAGFGYAALHVDDIDTVFGSASTAGAEILVEPVTHRPGARYALVADPDGNVWELLEDEADR